MLLVLSLQILVKLVCLHLPYKPPSYIERPQNDLPGAFSSWAEQPQLFSFTALHSRDVSALWSIPWPFSGLAPKDPCLSCHWGPKHFRWNLARAERENLPLLPADHAAFNAAQDAIGFLGHERTLLGHAQVFTHQ